MHADTRPGWVHLSVADLERSMAFYEGLLGLHVLHTAPGFAALGVPEGDGTPVPLLFLTCQPHARPKPPHCRGLYHLALRLPTRRDLAWALLRLMRHQYAVEGGADHGVSEAIYLSDPDGHGIELYADRSREQWPRQGNSILMATEPLDWQGLMAELQPEDHVVTAAEGRAVHEREGRLPEAQQMPPGTRLGHIHLHVSRLDRAERFYRDALGLDLVLRYGTSALFFSAGGYHHHVGVNIWAGRDAPPPPPDAVQLLDFSFVVPSAQDVAAVGQSLRQAGVALNSLEQLDVQILSTAGMAITADAGFMVHDEDGQAVGVVNGATA